MNISVILGHPTPGSFNHAIAAAAAGTLKAAGHTVLFHDLYAEQFDPLMTSAEVPTGAVMPEAIRRHADEICAADGIVIVHPNWWCQPPAILKGWIDRVLRPGMAYRFVPDGKGGGKPQGLLKAKTALVITTANNPQDKEVELYGDPLEVFWKKCVFGICSVPTVERLIFAPVIASTLEQRRQWLKDAEHTAGRLFS